MAQNFLAGIVTSDHCLCKISGRSDKRFRSYGRSKVKTRKNSIKIRLKLYIATSSKGSATKVCVHVDKYPIVVHTKFQVDRLNGLRFTGRWLSNFSFSLRKANGQYMFVIPYIAYRLEYCIKILHSCSLACSPALVWVSAKSMYPYAKYARFRVFTPFWLLL